MSKIPIDCSIEAASGHVETIESSLLQLDIGNPDAEGGSCHFACCSQY